MVLTKTMERLRCRLLLIYKIIVKRVIAGLVGIIGFALLVDAQNSIEIFADTKNNDSLRNLVTIFTDQLKKSSSVRYNILPTSAYNGRGFYFNTTMAPNPKVRPLAGLEKENSEGFSIEGNDQSVRIVGNSNMAVGHGMFTYLDLVGYRFYFANPDWHII